MHAETRALPARRFKAVPFALAVLCFFLPFVQFSCTMDRSMSYSMSGLQMVTGTEIQIPDMGLGGGQEIQKVEASPFAVMALLCSLAGLVLVMMPSRALSLAAVAFGVLGFLAMLLLKWQIDSDVAEQGAGMFVAEYRAGFVLVCVLLLAGAALNTVIMRQPHPTDGAGTVAGD